MVGGLKATDRFRYLSAQFEHHLCREPGPVRTTITRIAHDHQERQQDQIAHHRELHRSATCDCS